MDNDTEIVTISITVKKEGEMSWEEATGYVNRAATIIEDNLWSGTEIIETNLSSTRE